MARKKKQATTTSPAVTEPSHSDGFAVGNADIVRLEAEIHARLTSWLALEQQLGERLRVCDAELAQATAEVAAERLRGEQLQAALQEARQECARLGSQATTRPLGGNTGDDALRRQLREHRDAIAGLDQHAREQQKALQKAEHERDALAAALAGMQETHDRDRAGLSRSRERLATLEAEARTARELAGHQEKLEGELARARRLVASLTAELETSRDLTTRHETTLAAERLRSLELQKQLTDTTARDEEAGALRAEVARLAERLQTADKAAPEQRALVEKLRAELRTRRRIIAMLGRDLARAREMAASPDSATSWLAAEPNGSPGTDDETGSVRRLMIATEGEQVFRYPLQQEQVIIGRSSASDIRIGGGYTSRRHARILNAEDEVVIEDLGSVNGITVNDQRVTRSILHDGDLVEIGNTRFRFVDRSAATPPVVHN